MPDPEPLITADQSRQLLESALRHLTEARKIRAARPPGDRGTAGEEAALLIALAQAEAVLSIAGQLANFDDTVDSLAKVIRRFNDPGR